MSTIKISQLPIITSLNANTSNTIFVAVDKPTGVTGQFTAHTLAQGLYSNEILNVGSNPILYNNVIGQFSGSSGTYFQVNLQNFNANGSSDFVASTSDSDNASRFVDMGINGANFADPAYTSMRPYDAYMFSYGQSASSSTGNLIIGTASSGANIVFIAGGTLLGNVVGRVSKNSFDFFKDVNITGNVRILGATLGLKFADGTTQNTAGSSVANTIYLQSGLNVANANIAYVLSVNLLQNTNIGLANTLAQTATSLAMTAGSNTVYMFGVQTTQNNFIQTAWNTANNALANTSGVFAGDLTLTGNLIAAGIYSSAGPVQTGNLIVNGSTTSNGYTNIYGVLNVNGIVNMNAQVVLTNTSFSNTQSALTISATPVFATPSNDGYMIHISGKQNVSSRIVTDSYGANTYVVYAGRSARGNVSNPSAVKAGDILTRFSGNGFGTTKYADLGSGRLDIVAVEDFTDTARGTQLQLWNTPVGTNTLTNIATFNGVDVTFTGEVNPQKGLLLTPNVIPGMTTTLNIDIANNALYVFKTNATTTINLSNFKSGKIVEVWLTNTDTGPGSNHTITHGCFANNSTVGASSFTLTSLHTAYIKYFSIDGDLANTFCQVSYS